MKDPKDIHAKGYDLATWVRSGRKSKGMTQVELAVILEISTVHLSRIESGHAETTLEKISRMCGVFGKSFVIEGK